MRMPHHLDARDHVTEPELHEWIAHVDQPTRDRFDKLTAHLPREVEFGLAAHSLPIVDEVLAITKAVRIVEFGFGAGCSAAMWLANPLVKHVVSIDWTQNAHAVAAAHAMARAEAGRFVFVNADSRGLIAYDVVTALGVRAPDLVFVDGGHDYDTVAHDIRLGQALGMVGKQRRTKWLLLDDWWPHLGPGVQPAMAMHGGHYAKHRQWGNMVLFKAKRERS